jgi:hypothetical protein
LESKTKAFTTEAAEGHRGKGNPQLRAAVPKRPVSDRKFYSASDISRSMDGLCFSFLTRLGLSTRFTDGTLPIAARDMVLTAVVALKVFFFFFFGMAKEI